MSNLSKVLDSRKELFLFPIAILRKTNVSVTAGALLLSLLDPWEVTERS